MAKPSGNSALQETDIGPVPEDWGLARLRELTYEATERNQRLAYGREDVLSVDNELGLIPSDRLLGEDFARYQLVRRNQFAYNPMRLNVGSLGLWKDDRVGVVSPDYIVFGCREDQLDSDFLDLFRGSAAWKWQIQQSGQGSVRIRYYYRHIAEFWVPRPPLPEQRAIAHVLRTVQRAKEATEKVIAATRQLKASLMRHLFTFGPVPVVNAERVKLKESDIGMLPEHWEVRPLESLARLVSGGTPSKERSEYWNGPIPWASPKDMKQPRLADAEDHISSEAAQEGSRIVPPGSVFVVIRGMILARDFPIAQAKVPMAFNQDMKAILPGDDLDSDFLLYAMVHHRARILPEIGTSAHGTKRISTSAIANFALPLPPLSEQREIARILTCSDQSILAEESRRKALAASFRSILHHLMTGKLRVRDLDPTDHSHDGTAGG